MRRNAVGIGLFLFVLMGASQPAHAGVMGNEVKGFMKHMVDDINRGIKNVIGAPLEIPIAVSEHIQQNQEPPGMRELSGIADGSFNALRRLGSGVWDIVFASMLPGQQEGIPVEPETLF